VNEWLLWDMGFSNRYGLWFFLDQLDLVRHRGFGFIDIGFWFSGLGFRSTDCLDFKGFH
jgi:hypothetical protein